MKDDIKAKEHFEKSQAILHEKKQKALESRRNTIRRKRKRCALITQTNKEKQKRAKNFED